jgi:ABC-type antimicrobial peptide transport system permease subunit
MALPLSYPLRNLRARFARALMSVGVIALVVVACSLLLGLISSLKRTLVSTGDPLTLVVLRKGSGNDGSSQISLDAYRDVRFFEGIARNAGDQPLVSPEIVVQPFARTIEGGRENVLVRGVEPIALEVHPEVRVTQGRMFRPSSGEAVVGKGTTGRYVGARLGDAIEVGHRPWRVVGVLESGGSSFESEIWVDARELAADAKRIFPYSGLRIRAAGPGAMEPLIRRIDDDPRHALEAQRETEYYAEQAESANTLYLLVLGIAALAGIGACFGAANTMYAAVQARTAEIGTLRALGFSRGTILRAFQVEAVALSLVGFALGAVLALGLEYVLRLLLGGIAFGAATFTTNVISLHVSASDLAVSFLLALVIGFVGGLGPAWRAARMRPIEALRKA